LSSNITQSTRTAGAYHSRPQGKGPRVRSTGHHFFSPSDKTVTTCSPGIEPGISRFYPHARTDTGRVQPFTSSYSKLPPQRKFLHSKSPTSVKRSTSTFYELVLYMWARHMTQEAPRDSYESCTPEYSYMYGRAWSPESPEEPVQTSYGNSGSDFQIRAGRLVH